VLQPLNPGSTRFFKRVRDHFSGPHIHWTINEIVRHPFSITSFSHGVCATHKRTGFSFLNRATTDRLVTPPIVPVLSIRSSPGLPDLQAAPCHDAQEIQKTYDGDNPSWQKRHIEWLIRGKEKKERGG